MAKIKVDGTYEEYISIAHSTDTSRADFYVTELPSNSNGNVYKGFFIKDNVAHFTNIDQDGWKEYDYSIGSNSLVTPKVMIYNGTDNTYVNIDKLSECGKNYTLRANELDTLMNNLEEAFNKTLDAGWVDDNSAKLKMMFKDFIEESKKINSDIRDYGKTITEVALKYSTEQKNSMTKLEGEEYGK